MVENWNKPIQNGKGIRVRQVTFPAHSSNYPVQCTFEDDSWGNYTITGRIDRNKLYPDLDLVYVPEPAVEPPKPAEPGVDWTKPLRTKNGHRVLEVVDSNRTDYPKKCRLEGQGWYYYTDRGSWMNTGGLSFLDLENVPEEPAKPAEPVVDWTKPIQTVDGRKARVGFTDFKNSVGDPMVVVAVQSTYSDRAEQLVYVHQNGVVPVSGSPGNNIINVPEEIVDHVKISYTVYPNSKGVSGVVTGVRVNGLVKDGKTCVINANIIRKGEEVTLELEK